MKSELKAIHKRLGEIFDNTKCPTEVVIAISDCEGEVPFIRYSISEKVLPEKEA